MALGLLSKKGGRNVVSDSPPLANVPPTEKIMHGNEGYGGEPFDPESQGGPRRLSRIDKPVGAADVDSDDSSGMSVGKQMELEAGNAIKYRTCSWPKV